MAKPVTVYDSADLDIAVDSSGRVPEVRIVLRHRGGEPQRWMLTELGEQALAELNEYERITVKVG